MKQVRYFLADAGKLKPIDILHPLIQGPRWHKDETLKIEMWPFDLKIGPCTQIPYGKKKQEQSVEEFINRPESERKGPNQKAFVRFDQARTPYSEEFTRRDDARNRAHISSKIPKGWKNRKVPSAQDDAPF